MSEITKSTKPIPKAIECRFAVYAKSNVPGDYSDMHLIKEQVHNADGTITPNIRQVIDYQRPFYVVKKGKQNYQDKREWCDLEDLNVFKSTQTNLGFAVAKALDKAWSKLSLRDLSDSPYLYGSDILSTSLIKQSYADKWDTITPYSNAVFDTETDVIHGTGQIWMATVSFKDRVFTAVQKRFVEGYANPVERIKELAKKYIGDTIEARNITLNVMICDSEIEVVRHSVNKGHEWMPDFMSVWNLAFDMDKIIEACTRAGVTPESILCDPAVEEKYRSFRFKKGAPKKTTASGKVMNYKPAQRWHTVFCPSSFYWVDAMGIYKQVRTGQPEETSYSLDAMLKKNLKNITKLKFAEADKYSGLEWHQFMQTNYPLEYVVYNMFDCISMEILDEKTLDVQLSFPMQAGCTDFQHFNSQPKRTVNDLHFFCLKNKKVVGSTASDMVDDFDAETTTLDGWIVMLPSHLVADNGLKIIEESPNIATNIRCHVGDLDVAGSYPNGECVFNVSKETTSKELLGVDGIDRLTQRMQTINLSAGRTNSVEFAVNMYGLPTFDDLLAKFNQTVST